MSSIRVAAGTLALSLALSACAPAPTAPAGDGTPVGVGATAAPSTDAAAPTEAPSAAPSAVASAGASPAASPSASAPNTAPTPDPSRRLILSGSVYDASGATVDRAVVRIRSLDASVPYEATATTAAGSYVFNNVPEGANVEVTASRDGWTTRSRVAAFQRSEQRNLLDFGSPRSNANGPGAAFFLSKHPEIVRTEPADAAVGRSADKLVYKLTLSEPLDREGRSRFEDALRILPANDAANGGQGGTTRALEDLEDDGYPLARAIDDEPDTAPYVIEKGTTFRGDAARAARVAWNAIGTEATFTFDAPLATQDNEEAEYQVVLASGGDAKRIRDEDGDQLGTDENGRLNAYPDRGAWILSAFKARDLRLADIPGLSNGSQEERWAATHDNVATFEVAKDTTDPRLQAVAVSTRGNDTRIALTFSEAMAAFDGTEAGLTSAALGDDAGDLANYTFMIGEDRGDLGDTELEGEGLAVDPITDDAFGDERGDFEEEFRFAPAAFAADRASAGVGSVFVEVDEDDPRVVLLWVVGRPDFFADAKELRARVERVADPAGNDVAERDADDNQPTARL